MLEVSREAKPLWTQFGEADLLQERLHESLYVVIELVISKSLKNTKGSEIQLAAEPSPR